MKVEEKRKFWVSVLLASGLAMVVNSNWLLLSFVGAVFLVIGYIIAIRKPSLDYIFWSCTGITIGIPTLVYGANIYQYSLTNGIFVMSLAGFMIIVGFILFFLYSRNQAKNVVK